MMLAVIANLLLLHLVVPDFEGCARSSVPSYFRVSLFFGCGNCMPESELSLRLRAE